MSVLFARARSFLRARFSREGTVGLYLTAGFVASAFVVLLFGSLAGFVSGPEGYALDRHVTLAVRRWHTPGHDRLLRDITALGDFLVLLPATLAVTAALAWKGHRVSARLFAGSVAGGFLLNSLLKWSFERVRPDLWPPLVTEHTFSFPSGHTSMATVFYGGVVAVVFHLTPSARPRLACFLGAAALIAAVAVSRVYLGAHWLTDVVGGLLVGLFWVILCATGTEFLARRQALRQPGNL